MFCICCLKQNSIFINLENCIHGEYLQGVNITQLHPLLKRIVCTECHRVLKNIYQFKLQVEESINLLSKQGIDLVEKKYKKSNMVIAKAVDIEIIDDSINIETKKNDIIQENTSKININKNIKNMKNNKEIIEDKPTKINKNIEIALEILNNNATSLQSLTECNFKNITDTLLTLTGESLNFELGRIVTLAVNKGLNKESVGRIIDERCSQKPRKNDTVLPAKENLTDIAQDNNKMEIDETNTNKIDIEDVFNKAVLVDNDNILPTNTNINSSDISNTTGNIELLVANNPQITLKTEDKMIIDTKNMLPIKDISTPLKVVEENVNKIDVVEVVLPDIKNIEASVTSDDNLEIIKEDDGVVSSNVPPPIIPIRLKRKELELERLKKLKCNEYLNCTYKCDLCIIGFKFKDNYNHHMKRKHEMRDGCVLCKVCQQVVNKDDLNRHKYRHYNRLQCNECKISFVLFDEAYTHYRKVHNFGKNKNKISKRNLRAYWINKKKDLKQTKEVSPLNVTTAPVPGTSTEIV